jgi:glycosyltransferase involved in cell wall biosynthesis
VSVCIHDGGFEVDRIAPGRVVEVLMTYRKLLILGTRGIPAKYGGFETFAERLAIYLCQEGWEVTVYCQKLGQKTVQKQWQNITLVEISVPKDNSFWSIVFDFKATMHALRQHGIILVLGYNTAIFSLIYYISKRISVMNMDGIEWHRKKWNLPQKIWLYLNEKCALWFSTHIIADHPQIKLHYLDKKISRNKISVIPYCSDPVRQANIDILEKYSLEPDRYALIVARPEPENSILETVSAFSQHRRGYKLVILGEYVPQESIYHQKVLESASAEVLFPGAVYSTKDVQALRYYARLYIHGHTVGGTNPSLVEAIAAGMPVLAHFNRFNYWIAGSDSRYFYDQEDCCFQLDKILDDDLEISAMRKASLIRYQRLFADNRDIKAYKDLFLSYARKEGGNEKFENVLPQTIRL